MKNDYFVVDEEVFIYLRNIDDFTIINLCDLEKANSINRMWYGKFDNKTRSHYAAVCDKSTGKQKTIFLHRMLHSVYDSKVQIDHKDRDSLNNRRSNLAIVTAAQNMQNGIFGKRQSSGYAGVCWNKTAQKWQAQIRVNGIKKYIGCFEDPEEAHSAYIAVKEKAHEYWAELNRERSRTG